MIAVTPSLTTIVWRQVPSLHGDLCNLLANKSGHPEVEHATPSTPGRLVGHYFNQCQGTTKLNAITFFFLQEGGSLILTLVWLSLNSCWRTRKKLTEGKWWTVGRKLKNWTDTLLKWISNDSSHQSPFRGKTHNLVTSFGNPGLIWAVIQLLSDDVRTLLPGPNYTVFIKVVFLTCFNAFVSCSI